MRRTLTLNLLSLLAVGTAFGQSAVDAYNVTPTQLRGTARFVGMGGAFTSLGGDLSSMNQNPAGLGMYRSSDVGLTFDISARSVMATTASDQIKETQTKAFFDNVGYVGTFNMKGALKSLSFGVSYSRVATFDRVMSGYLKPSPGSLSNYVASFTQGVNSGDLLDDTGYNPYFDSAEDWLSILSYQSALISNTSSDTQYAGLNVPGTTYGDAEFSTREWGGLDEYSINIAGNVNDMVYWGAGVNITDLNYNSANYYSESMENALVYNKNNDRLVNGNAGFGMDNVRSISGTGVNLKFGAIVRLADFLRIGAAVHTPTWMSLRHQGYGSIQSRFTPNGDQTPQTYSCDTPNYDYDSRLTSPWRFMFGASATIGSYGIISVDYERVEYGSMSMKEAQYTGYQSSFVPNKYANGDIKDWYKGSNIIRIGLEGRITSQFSVRLGASRQMSNVKDAAYKGETQIYTSGTDPSYTFNDNTTNFAVGLGYRISGWYIDLTYQHTNQKSTYRAYTPYDGFDSPSAELNTNHNNVILTTGFRF